MTLVIAAQGRRFVIMAADSRGILEEEGGTKVSLNRFAKLTRLNRLTGVLMYGAIGPAKYLVEEYAREPRIEAMGVSASAKKLAALCREKMKEIPALASRKIPAFGFVVAGLDATRNGEVTPRCLGFSSTDGFWIGSYDHFAIEGKPLFAYFAFAKSYHDELNRAELTELVAQTMYDTIMTDVDVGGRIRMAEINPQSGFTEIDPSDIERIIDHWENPPRFPRKGAATTSP